LSESYSYNENYQLGTKTVSNSNAQDVVAVYSYPEGTTPAIIQKMVQKNMLTPVINEVKKIQTSPSTAKEISGYKIDYKEFNPENTTIIMPENLYELDGTTYSLNMQALSYTKHGNLQEILTRDNMHTVYLWGYDYRYLIAEIKNATLSQVSSAVQSLFSMSVEALAKTNPDITKLKNLRSNVNLSAALITTYTFGSWGKVTSLTTPSGRTTYFSYDGFGRLKESYYYESDDPNKKRIIESHDYHYKN
jgi:hypothetical protein